jgi:hypothetical protein
MKKILLLTVCIQLLASCGYACMTPVNSGDYLNRICRANKCDYYGYGNSGMTYNIWTSNCSK